MNNNFLILLCTFMVGFFLGSQASIDTNKKSYYDSINGVMTRCLSKHSTEECEFIVHELRK